MTIRPFTGDPLSACCGTPDACSQAHLYCFNRSPKEANVEAMHVFEATFDKTLKTTQAAINEATHGSVVDVAEAMASLDAQLEEIEAVVDHRVTLGPETMAWHTSKAEEDAKRAAKVKAEVEQLLSLHAKDEIKRPDHYARFAIEPCTFIMLNELPYWTGNVVKYVVRAPHKHGDERIDIRKAIRYCEMRIEELDRVAAGTDGAVVGNPL